MALCSSCEPLAPMGQALRGPGLMGCIPLSTYQVSSGRPRLACPTGAHGLGARSRQRDPQLPDGLVPSEAAGSLAKTESQKTSISNRKHDRIDLLF